MKPLLRSLVLAAVAVASSSPLAAAAAPAPFLPVDREHLALPRGVQPWLSVWTADGRHVVFRNQADRQVWMTGADGTGTRCVTCAFPDQPAVIGGGGFTYAFPDGRRLFLASKELGATGGGDDPAGADAYVLECAPSLVDCTSHSYVPVDLSGDKGASFIVQRRTWHLAPDGEHLGWMDLRLDGTVMVVGRLAREADRYRALDVKAVNPPGPTGPQDTSADRLENASQLYELKSFADGGRSILAVGERASNTDVLKVDLRSGRTTRLTGDEDWDEDGAEAPDGRSQLVASWRTRDRLGVSSWLPQLRSFAGLQLGAALAPYYVSTWEGFQCDLSPWLLPAGGDAGGRLVGQPLDVYAGNLTAANNLAGLDVWSPDSTRVLLQEKLRTPPPADANADVAQKGLVPNRIAIARIDRPVTRRQRVVASEVGDWAPDAATFRGTLAGDRTVVVRGARGGRATVTYQGNLLTGSVTARFTRFTDDGRTFVDGTMAVGTTDARAKPWTIAIAVRVTGAHTGRMDADLAVDNSTKPLPTMRGTWTADYDGRAAPPLPRLGPCYARLPKANRLAVATARAARGVRVTVTADIAGDRRPVRGATVRLGRLPRRTAARGRATLPVRRGRVVATAGDTFVRGSARMPR